ncbi:hypothetical protein BD410DRAFT_826381 [Rickenella mellea]|uniref:Skg3/CAF120-like PH-like domain-containing protein n=1 Tax=Rickenella mellea TaxID=50990 RepID=A0A4Y7QF11_9AGAM|nr:hypothetical protein BD410DRAFT_826381 [Rickenella mellea]
MFLSSTLRQTNFNVRAVINPCRCRYTPLGNPHSLRRTYASLNSNPKRQTYQDVYRARNRAMLMYTTAVILVAGGMSYAAVPLYRAFCAATGFAGTPQVGTGKFAPERLVPVDKAKRIKVHFTAQTSEALPWSFVPQQKHVSVLPGETSLAFYKATNKSTQDIVGIATYNVTPDRIAPYFAKVECFCFEEQKLLAGEEVDMPLLFFIDKDILDDPACRNVDDMVLSYTFFKARRNAQGHLEPDAAEDVVQASQGFAGTSTTTTTVTVTPPPPSTSPKWDSRNHGFVSPQRLSEIQMSSRQRLISSTSSNYQPSPNPQDNTNNSSAASPKPAHGRTISLFSFSRNRNSTANLPSPEVPPKGGPDDFGSRPSLQINQPALPMAEQQTPGGPGPVRRAQSINSAAPQPPPPAPTHPEIRSVVQLSLAHAQKIYFSGPLIRRVERQPDGTRPAKDDGWRDVWAQLGGTTLSVWDMQEIEEANKRGEQVPPTYVNVTDAFVQVLGSVTIPATPTSPQKKYTNVVTLNTAGSNLLLFACQSTAALISWAAALRLAAWEKSRLEEIYTAHLIRMSLTSDGVWKDPRSPLMRGKLEGWVKIRLAGQTDWKRLWLVIQAATAGHTNGDTSSIGTGETPASPRKNRMSALFGSRSHSPPPTTPTKALLTLFTSAKPKDKKKPLLSMSDFTQVFAVYPERPELISRSTLIKLEGMMGDEEVAGGMKGREGWLLIMPETEAGKLGSLEMLKWLVAFHDAFGLYGRPQSYTWDPREQVSMMFGYPVGPRKNMLFLEREAAESLDPRDDRTSAVRANLQSILAEKVRMQGPSPGSPPPGQMNGGARHASPPPSLPPLQRFNSDNSNITQQQQQQQAQSPSQSPPPPAKDASPQHTPRTEGNLPQLPQLTFDPTSRPGASSPPTVGPSRTALTPITERSHTMDSGAAGSRQNTVDDSVSSRRAGSSSDPQSATGSGQHQFSTPPTTVIEEPSRNIGPGQAAAAAAAMAAATVGPGKQSMDSQRDISHGVVAPKLTQSSSVRSGSTTDGAEGVLPSPGTPPSSVSMYSRSTMSQPRTPSSLTNHAGPVRGMSQSSDTPLSPASNLASPHSPMGMETNPQQSMDLVPPPRIGTPNAYGNRAPTPPATFIRSVQPPQQPAERQSASTPIAAPSPKFPATKALETSSQDVDQLLHEAGALYYMQQQQQDQPSTSRRKLPPAVPQGESDEESGSSTEQSQRPQPVHISPPTSPLRIRPRSSSPPEASPPPRRQTPMSFNHSPATAGGSSASAAIAAGNAAYEPTSRQRENPGSSSTSRTAPLGRKPSGARPLSVAGGKARYNSDVSSLGPTQEDEDPESVSPVESTDLPYASTSQRPQFGRLKNMAFSDFDGPDADALAALSFLEREESEQTTASKQNMAQQPQPPPPPPPEVKEPAGSNGMPAGQFRSSFAPSKQAEERKKRSQAQAAAHDAVLHKPGRPNGRAKAVKKDRGAWGESSEEEEEEEEEEDDEDADSDGQPATAASGSRSGHGLPPSITAARNQMYSGSAHGHGQSPSGSAADLGLHPNRPPRTLPQIPGMPGQRSAPGSEDYHGAPSSRRMASDQYSDAPRRSNYENATQVQHQPPAPRQNVWSTVLDSKRDPSFQQPNQDKPQGRDTFVQLDSPSETMTKAFTPQGLLSAGLQDKEDRSAKRQEEVARETGASLINVPNKPPPPQVGLLGAITAHERERKREGGMGAALTEREREKRLAEERQRKLDEFQRQQLDQQQQMAQGGSMYGGMYPGMPPQMTGFNPMMSPGMSPGAPFNPQMMQSMYFNPMFANPMAMSPMAGFNPQHMFAAQQAAQAYQQAMMSMSAAGSQVGGEDGGRATSPNPMMAPGGMNMGFDPRMSMMGMGMGMQGTGGMGFSPGMGMGMGGGTPMGGPMGMNMTGGTTPAGASGFDPRFSMGPNQFDANLRPPGEFDQRQSPRITAYNTPPQGGGSPAGSTGPRAIDAENPQ